MISAFYLPDFSIPSSEFYILKYRLPLNQLTCPPPFIVPAMDSHGGTLDEGQNRNTIRTPRTPKTLHLQYIHTSQF